MPRTYRVSYRAHHAPLRNDEEDRIKNGPGARVSLITETFFYSLGIICAAWSRSCSSSSSSSSCRASFDYNFARTSDLRLSLYRESLSLSFDMIKHRHKKNNDAGTLVRGVGGNVSARSRSDLHRSQKNQQQQQQQQQYPPQVVRRRKLRGRSVSRSWPGTPNTQSIVSTTSSEVNIRPCACTVLRQNVLTAIALLHSLCTVQERSKRKNSFATRIFYDTFTKARV
ncbi:unnamed protein product [Trichogramma brassicae]|uniref:Uncharacterized protein n=1 Tax=Trichogramma brassicae TaxID=86971 RepID=A0A6H5I172_9HYME|nr:unnamed protein product [Trichogramma brassicae]